MSTTTDTDDDRRTTRAEHHADTDAVRVRQSRARVTRALLDRHVGREQAVHGSTLADALPIAETTVRDIIAELRDDPAGPPIGNCGDGYYVLADADELDAWVADVKAEIATKRERLQANVRAFNRREGVGE